MNTKTIIDIIEPLYVARYLDIYPEMRPYSFLRVEHLHKTERGCNRRTKRISKTKISNNIRRIFKLNNAYISMGSDARPIRPGVKLQDMAIVYTDKNDEKITSVKFIPAVPTDLEMEEVVLLNGRQVHGQTVEIRPMDYKE